MYPLSGPKKRILVLRGMVSLYLSMTPMCMENSLAIGLMLPLIAGT
jgi:hypothetical protein